MDKKKPKIFVKKVDTAIADKLREGLIAQGFTLATPAYTIFQGKKKGVVCTLYQSGKLMIQGKDMAEFIEFYIEPEILGEFSYTYEHLNIDKTPRIGVDESGKGDFFGPLCVAGVYADEEAIDKLYNLGVADSKTISDKKIYVLAKEIKAICRPEVIKIFPAKYNELYEKFSNLNKLLAWGHSKVIENLVAASGCSEVIIDQFASEHVVRNAVERKGLTVNLKQRHRAESDLVVAAASILAREAFLSGMQKLEKEFGLALPKGASSKVLEAGKAFIAKYGIERLPEVCKAHFKTFSEITT